MLDVGVLAGDGSGRCKRAGCGRQLPPSDQGSLPPHWKGVHAVRAVVAVERGQAQCWVGSHR
jgi:hypothetical protein